MPGHVFSFLADDLVEDANQVASYLENHGYLVKADHELVSAPDVPTLYAKRHKTEMVVLVGSTVDMDRLKNWCAYGKSTGRDFRICYAVKRGTKIKSRHYETMRYEGVGMLRSSTNVIEEIAPKDLGLTVSLPALQSLPPNSRKHLGAAYEQFNRSQWREGFEEACQSLENLAREYLINEIKKTRVQQFIQTKGPIAAKVDRVQKMTLGQLARAFTEIPNQNQTDAQLGKVLLKINKDRVGVAHRKHHSKTEARLRKNVGMHMWAIISGIKLLC